MKRSSNPSTADERSRALSWSKQIERLGSPPPTAVLCGRIRANRALGSVLYLRALGRLGDLGFLGLRLFLGGGPGGSLPFLDQLLYLLTALATDLFVEVRAAGRLHP